MKISIEQKIRLGFSLAVGFLLVIGGVAYWSAARAIETDRSVDKAYEVLDELERAVIGALEAETSSRGYAITGDERFLARYDPGIQAVDRGLKNLRRLVQDSPIQQHRLDKLDRLLAQKRGWIALPVDARRARGLKAAGGKGSIGEADELLDQVRQGFLEMEGEERHLLASSSAEAQREARLTIRIVLLGSAVGLCVLGLASALVRRDFRKRREAEAERDRFFNLSRDLLCISGFDGYFKNLNPVWENVLGFTRAELLAKPYIEFVHPEDRAGTIAEAARLAAGGEVALFQNRFLCKDGAFRWLSWSVRSSIPQRRIYATARDITEQKQIDARIAALNADLASRATQLQGANAELEAFSYSVSHDLRAPLRHLGGYVDLLTKNAGASLDNKGLHYLASIAGAARQMGVLIDDLLGFSRMARAELQRSRISLADLVREVKAQLRQDLKGRVVQWKIQPLPRVEGDASMLRVVLMNLLSNAVKYTRPRNPASIEIGCQKDEREHIIFVRDNGVGFDMQYKAKLFGVFQRLHYEEDFEGTGIGLANVRRIVLRHGGRVWAEGKEGEGATFYFSLPKTGGEADGTPDESELRLAEVPNSSPRSEAKADSSPVRTARAASSRRKGAKAEPSNLNN